MTEADLIAIGKDAVKTILLVASPALGIGIIIGLAVSIFQATTQIQEQTLTFVPKIIAVLVAIIFFGPWMLRNITSFTKAIFENLASFIR